MLTAGFVFRETPRKGHRPKNLESTKLLTKTIPMITDNIALKPIIIIPFF